MSSVDRTSARNIGQRRAFPRSARARQLAWFRAIYQNKFIITSLSVPDRGNSAVTAPPSFGPPTEAGLREFFEQSLNLVCIAGTDGYFRYVNPAWEKTFGYSRNELVSRPYLEFVHPEDREGTIDQAAHVASGGNIVSFENRYRCKDGSYKWLMWSGVLLREKGLICAIATDVTERKSEETRQAAQYAITRVLAEAPTLSNASPRILQAICESLDWSMGAIWRVDQRHDLLRCVETWRMSSAPVEEFDRATHAQTFPRGVGLPGRVWAQAQPTWIEDVTPRLISAESSRQSPKKVCTQHSDFLSSWALRS